MQIAKFVIPVLESEILNIFINFFNWRLIEKRIVHINRNYLT